MRTLFVLALALVALFPAVVTALPETQAVERAVAYVRLTQQPDGGFGGFGAGQTFDAVYALRAAGIDPATVVAGGKSPRDFLVASAPAQTSPAAAAKAALAARALGMDPSAVGGVDLLARITTGVAATGRYAFDDFSQSLAMLGVACLGAPADPRAVKALKAAQLADGGWGFEGFSDADTTAMALQALRASGVAKFDVAVVAALGYLRATQLDDGGWGFGPESNANSTALVVQALLAAGEQPEASPWDRGTTDPVAYLLSQQQADGSFAGFDPAFATNQVLPALAGRTVCNAVDTPIRPVPPAASTPVPAPRPDQPLPPLPPKTGSGVIGGKSMPGPAAIFLTSVVFGAGVVVALRRSHR